MITQEVKQNRDTPPLPAPRGEPCPVIFAVSSPISLHAFAPPTGSWAWFLLPLHLGALGLPAPWWKWCWDCSAPRPLGAGQFSPYPHGVKLPYCKEDLARLLMLRRPPPQKKREIPAEFSHGCQLSVIPHDSKWLRMEQKNQLPRRAQPPYPTMRKKQLSILSQKVLGWFVV